MLLAQWISGPSVAAIGFYFPGMECPWIATMSAGYCSATLPTLPNPDWRLDKIQEDELRRRSGVQRARSCSLNAVYAGSLAKYLLATLSYPVERGNIGICTASSSTVTVSAYNFERRGLSEGWSAVDPLSLPHTIPSSLATHIAISLGIKGFTLAFLDGFLGLFHCLGEAGSYLADQPNSAVLVLVAEEASDVQRAALHQLNLQATPRAGAAGMLLLGSGYTSSGPKLSQWSHGANHEDLSDLKGISCSEIVRLSCTSGMPYLHTFDAALAIFQLFSKRKIDQVVIGDQGRRGWCAVAFKNHA